MDQIEMVALIKGGVPASGGVWADLGAGTGNFTWALAQLLGAQATIYAMDRDARAVAAQCQRMLHDPPPATVVPRQVDFTQQLALPPLDGVLLANVLHFIKDQTQLLARLATLLQPEGRLLVVEYEVQHPLRYVPFPVPFRTFAGLAAGSGFGDAQLVGQRRSLSSGISMYSGAVTKLH